MKDFKRDARESNLMDNWFSDFETIKPLSLYEKAELSLKIKTDLKQECFSKIHQLKQLRITDTVKLKNINEEINKLIDSL